MSRILLLCWRDVSHPQGGGSERYLEHVGAALAARGHEVVYRTSAVAGAPRSQARNGVRFSRGGGRFTVYPRAWAAILAGRVGVGPLRSTTGSRHRFDVVIDTQNGVPFFARLVAGAPTILLSHHCHREQWPVAGPLVSRLGWWIESGLSPRLHRSVQYVTVSRPSAGELVELGVDPDRVAVVRNGVDLLPVGVTAGSTGSRAPGPRLVVLSRLVPHKHVEDAIDVVAALRPRHPDLVLDVVGDGWWAQRLRQHADTVAPAGSVEFHGHLGEAAKHRVLAGAAVHLMPSRKEGWGLAVTEAAQHAVPTIGYLHATGLRDSVDDGVTGLLVTDAPAMTSACARLLADPTGRESMGERARTLAAGYTWEATGRAWADLVDAALRGRVLDGVIGSA